VTLLVAAGCDDEALVSFTVFSAPGRLEPGMVTVRYSDDGRTRTLSGDDFVGDGQRLDTQEFVTRTRSRLAIEVEIESGAGRVAGGALDIPLQLDWRWNVDPFLDERNPYDMGGNSISCPVVY
jgi:hypothetical protein